jgi:hypothetical protein
LCARPARPIGTAALGYGAAPIGTRCDAGGCPQQSRSAANVGAVRAFRLGGFDGNKHSGGEQGCSGCPMQYFTYDHYVISHRYLQYCRDATPGTWRAAFQHTSRRTDKIGSTVRPLRRKLPGTGRP